MSPIGAAPARCEKGARGLKRVFAAADYMRLWPARLLDELPLGRRLACVGIWAPAGLVCDFEDGIF